MQRRAHVAEEQDQGVRADETAPEPCTTQTTPPTTAVAGTGASGEPLSTRTQVMRPQEPEVSASGNPGTVGHDGAGCDAYSVCAPNRESEQQYHAAATSQSTQEAGGDTRNVSMGSGGPDGDMDAAESYEHRHVHTVYESIAGHFSSTRYKPWPMVSYFLQSQTSGSVGLDVGCGNGKYLPLAMEAAGAGAAAASRVERNQEEKEGTRISETYRDWPHLFMIGCDRSANLVRLARDNNGGGGDGGNGERKATNEVAVADGLDLPFPPGRADFAICIAVVHHLSTRARRTEAVKKLLECVRPPGKDGGGGGQILVYVWALEQADSRRGFDEGSTDQDLLVPWVLKEKKGQQAKQNGAKKKERSRKKKEEKKRLKKARQGRGESSEVAGAEEEQDHEGAEDEVGGVGGGGGGEDQQTVEDGRESPTATGYIPSGESTAMTASTGEQKSGDTEPSPPSAHPAVAPPADKTYQRYYHLYRQGELEEDVVVAGGRVLNSGYERDNWWCIASPQKVH